MKKDSMLPAQASEQPPKSGASAGPAPKNMPGSGTKGGKMPHEVMNDKMASKLGC